MLLCALITSCALTWHRCSVPWTREGSSHLPQLLLGLLHIGGPPPRSPGALRLVTPTLSGLPAVVLYLCIRAFCILSFRLV